MSDETARARGSGSGRAPQKGGTPRRRNSPQPRGNSLILIGMAGAGKSTVGRRLSRRYGKRFIDIDDVLVAQEGRSVADLAASLPFQEFVRRESRAACSVRARNAIIATGGSVIYSRRSMEHLRTLGTVVYLNKPFHETRRYSGDPKKRGIVMPPDQTPETYQMHRHRLYLRYADIVLWTKNAKIHETVGYLSGILEYIDPEHFEPLPNLVRYRPKPRKQPRGKRRGRGTKDGRRRSQGQTHSQKKDPRRDGRVTRDPQGEGAMKGREPRRKGAPPEGERERGASSKGAGGEPRQPRPHPRKRRNGQAPRSGGGKQAAKPGTQRSRGAGAGRGSSGSQTSGPSRGREGHQAGRKKQNPPNEGRSRHEDRSRHQDREDEGRQSRQQ